MGRVKKIMETKYYTVTKIEGEYAYISDEDGQELFIAMALLPEGADRRNVPVGAVSVLYVSGQRYFLPAGRTV